MLKLTVGSRHNSDPFGKRNKFRQHPNPQLLHNLLSVGFDRALGPAQRAGETLVGVANDDKVEDLPLARCQLCDKRANDVQLSLLIASHFMPCESPLSRSSDDTGLVKKSSAPALMARTVTGMSR